MKKFVLLTVLLTAVLSWGALSDFEDLTLASDSYWNGSDGSGGFTSGSAAYNNYYDDSYGPYWEGFAYSNKTDTETAGYTNQYSAITGSAYSGSNYAVAYCDGFYGTVPTITFDAPVIATSAYFTNTTYAYLAMLNGEPPATAFGPDDWFKLTITGRNAQGVSTGFIDFLLADGTNLIDTWTQVDLTSLGVVSSLDFILTSTDNGQFGMNTPAYFAMDDLATVVPEPATMVLLAVGTLMVRRKK